MNFKNQSFLLFRRDVIIFLINFFTSVFIARSFGPELLGIWYILLLLPNYSDAFGRLKFDVSSVYFIGKNKYNIGDIIFHLNIVAILSGAILILFFILLFNYINLYILNLSNENIIYFYFILIVIPIQNLFSNYSYFLISQEKIKEYNNMLLIKALISSIGPCMLIILFNSSIWMVLIPYILSLIISLVYVIYIFHDFNNRINLSINKKLLIDFFNHSFPLYLTGITGYLNLSLIKIYTTSLLSPASLSFYSIAQDRTKLLDTLPNAINLLVYSKVSKSTDELSEKLTLKSFRVIFLILIFISFFVVLLAKPLIIILYGYDFIDVLIPLYILLPGIIINGSTSVLLQYFLGTGRSKLVFKLSLYPLLFQAIFGFIMVKNFGIIGGATTFTISMIIYSFIKILFFINKTNSNIKLLLIKTEDIKLVFNFIKEKINVKKYFNKN